jgi:hypothetical protein
MSGSSKWSLSLLFPHQNHVYTSALPHYVLHALPIFLIGSPKQYRRGVQVRSFSLSSFLHSPITLSLLGPNILLKTLSSTYIGYR